MDNLPPPQAYESRLGAIEYRLPRLPAPADNAAMEADPLKAEPPKRKRRWFQFSLRTLLIFMLVCAVACAWLGRMIEQKRRERGAVEAIRKAGGSVLYDYQVQPSGRRMRFAEPTGPAWLRSLLGDNFFSDVDSVNLNDPLRSAAALAGPIEELEDIKRLDLSGAKLTDDDLDHLKGLAQLQTLWLAGNKISDAGLAKLGVLSQIKKLGLKGTKITDDGLVHLSRFSHLELLDLDDTAVTDVGLKHLRGFIKLQYLGLERTRITDAGVTQLQDLTNLQSLSLNGTRISNVALATLEGHVHLQNLYLRDTATSDAGIEHLRKLTGLQSLDLCDTLFTDFGLKRLADLRQLRFLFLSARRKADGALERISDIVELPMALRQNHFTDQGVAELQQALPNCRISR